MTGLVEDLLLLARLDAGRPLVREPVDLSLLLMEAVNDARVVAPDHTWRLSLPDEPVEVVGDEQRLHQVVTNLLTNARKYTPAGTTVTVTARPDGFDVHDDGPGFSAGVAEHAFERFVRGDAARHREGGAGLGLALVRGDHRRARGHRGPRPATRQHDDRGHPAGAESRSELSASPTGGRSPIARLARADVVRASPRPTFRDHPTSAGRAPTSVATSASRLIAEGSCAQVSTVSSTSADHPRTTQPGGRVVAEVARPSSPPGRSGRSAPSAPPRRSRAGPRCRRPPPGPASGSR